MTWTISDHDSVAAALTRVRELAGRLDLAQTRCTRLARPSNPPSPPAGRQARLLEVAGRIRNADRWAGDLMEDSHAAVPRRPTAQPRRRGRGLVAAVSHTSGITDIGGRRDL
jgi:hypothetical protein